MVSGLTVILVLLILAVILLLFRCYILKWTVKTLLDIVKECRRITKENYDKEFKPEFEKRLKENLKHHYKI